MSLRVRRVCWCAVAAWISLACMQSAEAAEEKSFSCTACELPVVAKKIPGLISNDWTIGLARVHR